MSTFFVYLDQSIIQRNALFYQRIHFKKWFSISYLHQRQHH